MTFGTFSYGSAPPSTIGDALSLEAKLALEIKLSMKPFHEAIVTAMQDAADGLLELEKLLGIEAPSPHLESLNMLLMTVRMD